MDLDLTEEHLLTRMGNLNQVSVMECFIEIRVIYRILFYP